MSATKWSIAAASVLFLLASGFAGAAPHQRSAGGDVSGHKSLIDAAKSVHINGQASPKDVSGVI